MKKILASILSLLAIIGLASCNRNTTPSYELVDQTSGTPIYNTWLGIVEYESTPIVARQNLTDSGYEIYLPKNIKDSAKYTVTSIENDVYDKENGFKDLFKSLNLTYLSLYNLNLQTIFDQVVTKKDDIKSNFSDLSLNDKVWESTTISVEQKELESVSYIEGKERSVVTLFVPVLINGYTAKSNSNAQHTLRTYALIPVYYEINYGVLNNEVLELDDDNKIKETYSLVRLKTSSYIVNGLAE